MKRRSKVGIVRRRRETELYRCGGKADELRMVHPGSGKAGDEISSNSSHGTGGLRSTTMAARKSAHAYTILVKMRGPRSDGG